MSGSHSGLFRRTGSCPLSEQVALMEQTGPQQPFRAGEIHPPLGHEGACLRGGRGSEFSNGVTIITP